MVFSVPTGNARTHLQVGFYCSLQHSSEVKYLRASDNLTPYNLEFLTASLNKQQIVNEPKTVFHWDFAPRCSPRFTDFPLAAVCTHLATLLESKVNTINGLGSGYS
jgi:hypothetical protein